MMVRDEDTRTLRDAGLLIGSRFAHEVSDRALQQARRRTALRDAPTVIRALPLRSVNEANSRASCLPSVAVAVFILGLAFLERAVPAAVGMVR